MQKARTVSRTLLSLVAAVALPLAPVSAVAFPADCRQQADETGCCCAEAKETAEASCCDTSGEAPSSALRNLCLCSTEVPPAPAPPASRAQVRQFETAVGITVSVLKLADAAPRTNALLLPASPAPTFLISFQDLYCVRLT